MADQRGLFNGNRLLPCLLLALLLPALAAGAQPPADQQAVLTYLQTTWNVPSWTDPTQCDGTFVTCDPANNNNVVQLYFNTVALTGTVLSRLGELTTLTSLYLVSNGLTSSIPNELSTLVNLNELSILYNNAITGAFPSFLTTFTKLTNLAISHTGISGTLPAGLGVLSKLIYLNLDGNGLTGVVPDSIGQLKLATFLDLSANSLSGSVPTTIGLLSSVKTLYLYFNQFSSSYPAELGMLTQVTYLALSHAQLTGTFPASLGNLVNINPSSNLDLQTGVQCPDATSPTSCGNTVAAYSTSAWCTAYCPAFCAQCTKTTLCQFYTGFKFQGSVLATLSAIATASDCCDKCSTTSTCLGFSLSASSQTCWLYKSFSVGITYSSDVSSGFKDPVSNGYCKNPCSLRLGATCPRASPTLKQAYCYYYSSPCWNQQCSCLSGYYAVCGPNGVLLGCIVWDRTAFPTPKVRCPA